RRWSGGPRWYRSSRPKVTACRPARNGAARRQHRFSASLAPEQEREGRRGIVVAIAAHDVGPPIGVARAAVITRSVVIARLLGVIAVVVIVPVARIGVVARHRAGHIGVALLRLDR